MIERRPVIERRICQTPSFFKRGFAMASEPPLKVRVGCDFNALDRTDHGRSALTHPGSVDAEGNSIGHREWLTMNNIQTTIGVWRAIVQRHRQLAMSHRQQASR